MASRLISRSEYIADIAVHIAGMVFAVVGGAILIVVASLEGRATPIVTTSIYTLGLVMMLGCSAIYNSLRPEHPHSWFRRADHAAIFVMIAGSCTPFALQGPPGWRILSLVILWSIALTAAGIKLFMPGRFNRTMLFMYLALGWGGAAIMAGTIASLPLAASILLGLGGVLYSVGVIFHVWDSLKFQNAIWHVFVLAAAICHYGAIMGGVVLAGD